MRIRNVLLATAFGLGVGAWSLVGVAQQDLPRRAEDAVQQTGQAIEQGASRLVAGTQPTAAGDVSPQDQAAILVVLREVTDAAMTKGGFDSMIERFSDADRMRLGKDPFTKQDHATLDGRIAQFQKDWQAKYNQEFKISDAKAVFNDETFVQGNVTDNARLASERQDPGGAAAAEKNPNPRAAFVIFPAANGLPETRVPFVQESMGRWKLDVPDTCSAQQIHDNVLRQLTTSDENKSQWPANANDAYENVAHRVFIAIINPDARSDNSNMGNHGPVDRNNASPMPMPGPDATPSPNPAPTPVR